MVTEPIDCEAVEWLEQRAEVMQVPADHVDFKSSIESTEGLIVRTYTLVDQAMIDAAPGLKVVGRAGVGVDNIDVSACQARGIAVVNTPDANRQAVVEYVLSIMLHLARPLPRSVCDPLDSEAWAQRRRLAMAARQLNEEVIGVLGCGRIGSRVAQVLTALGCSVQYHDLRDIDPADRCEAEPVDLDVLLQTSTVLTVHIDGRPENHGFLDSDRLALLHSEATLINTSRGFVLDEPALARSLEASSHRRAILDVHASEPIQASSPLLGHPQAMLLPHAASRTLAAQRAMSWVVRDVARVLGIA